MSNILPNRLSFFSASDSGGGEVERRGFSWSCDLPPLPPPTFPFAAPANRSTPPNIDTAPAGFFFTGTSSTFGAGGSSEKNSSDLDFVGLGFVFGESEPAKGSSKRSSSLAALDFGFGLVSGGEAGKGTSENKFSFAALAGLDFEEGFGRVSGGGEVAKGSSNKSSLGFAAFGVGFAFISGGRELVRGSSENRSSLALAFGFGLDLAVFACCGGKLFVTKGSPENKSSSVGLTALDFVLLVGCKLPPSGSEKRSSPSSSWTFSTGLATIFDDLGFLSCGCGGGGDVAKGSVKRSSEGGAFLVGAGFAFDRDLAEASKGSSENKSSDAAIFVVDFDTGLG